MQYVTRYEKTNHLQQNMIRGLHEDPEHPPTANPFSMSFNSSA